MSLEGELTAHTAAQDLAELEKLADLSGHFLQPTDEEAFWRFFKIFDISSTFVWRESMESDFERLARVRGRGENEGSQRGG